LSTKSVEIVDFLGGWDDVQKQSDIGPEPPAQRLVEMVGEPVESFAAEQRASILAAWDAAVAAARL
jgi:hypothetical protein